MRTILIATGLMLTVSAALAQEDLVIDQTKLYVTDPAACEAVEKQGVDAFMDMDFLGLTFEDGIQGMEFHCNFYDIKSRPYTPVLFVDAVCELPGELYADTMAIAPDGEDTIRLVSSADTALGLVGQIEPDPEGFYPAGTTIYHRCDNLSEIPFD
ncbi:hypothetical protein [Devosia ginsengisoli]|uniref:Uncharacterized protein n=1 Tax=Devosia ginsengisoli TaxID=400770 RepID=A0A5B8LPU2_9HYPH|nr:hypothetical protein [Devosia ginsengisoli]QDZ10297.1 hypothetical protein FPZ08_05760 [Devosia ginsengisoli]